MNPWDRHIELVEAVNATKTDRAHAIEEARLNGFREAMGLCLGFSTGHLVMEGDMHYIRAGVERPMCGGIFLDWRATEGS